MAVKQRGSGEKKRGNDKNRLWPLLLEAVSRDNVLPLTSACNLNCLFCSHRQNPPGVQTYSFAPLPVEQLKELIPLLDSSRKIIIGESSTRLCEGEPFTHPSFFNVLKDIRRLFPFTPVQITTNGTFLTTGALKELAALNRPEQGAGVELVISLNSASPTQRARMMGDPNPAEALRGLSLCRDFGLSFYGSVVALPHLCGWKDLSDTLCCLENEGALATRVFLPGYTSLADPSLHFPPSLWGELALFLAEMKRKLDHPLTLEPPFKKDLLATVEGVLRSSPAYDAGIRTGDLLLAVDGEKVLSGTDAFYRLKKAANPLVQTRRQGDKGPVSSPEEERSFTLRKKAGESPGVVFNADLDPGVIAAVSKAARQSFGRPVLLLTSAVASFLWKAAERKGLLEENVIISAVENRFFGGSICCVGLLTVADFKDHLKKITPLVENGRNHPLILVPSAPFDRRGYDLRGEHCQELGLQFPELSFSFC